MEEEHQKAIEEKQKSINEKDMQLALLDDDLTESENLVRELEFNNEEKNYGITIIAKNDGAQNTH